MRQRKTIITRGRSVPRRIKPFAVPCRSVPLNKSVITALRAHRLRQNEERLSVPEWHDYDLVFPNRIRRPTDHNNLYYREFKPLLKDAGLGDKGFTFLSLRHPFATALV